MAIYAYDYCCRHYSNVYYKNVTLTKLLKCDYSCKCRTFFFLSVRNVTLEPPLSAIRRNSMTVASSKVPAHTVHMCA